MAGYLLPQDGTPLVLRPRMDLLSVGGRGVGIGLRCSLCSSKGHLLRIEAVHANASTSTEGGTSTRKGWTYNNRHIASSASERKRGTGQHQQKSLKKKQGQGKASHLSFTGPRERTRELYRSELELREFQDAFNDRKEGFVLLDQAQMKQMWASCGRMLKSARRVLAQWLRDSEGARVDVARVLAEAHLPRINATLKQFVAVWNSRHGQESLIVFARPAAPTTAAAAAAEKTTSERSKDGKNQRRGRGRWDRPPPRDPLEELTAHDPLLSRSENALCAWGDQSLPRGGALDGRTVQRELLEARSSQSWSAFLHNSKDPKQKLNRLALVLGGLELQQWEADVIAQAKARSFDRNPLRAMDPRDRRLNAPTWAQREDRDSAFSAAARLNVDHYYDKHAQEYRAPPVAMPDNPYFFGSFYYGKKHATAATVLPAPRTYRGFEFPRSADGH